MSTYNNNKSIMSKILFNTKSNSIKILSEYFRKFNINELKYYLNMDNNINIPAFFSQNIYEPEDVELKNLLLSHLKISIQKIFYIHTELNIITDPINISFVSNLIYWDDLFVIKNNIFISTQYLTKIFELIEYNEYKDANNVYLCENKIYDYILLKKLTISIYSILQNLNKNTWEDYICSKFHCQLVPLENITFINQYKILREFNNDFMQNNIVVYWMDSNNIYCSFNEIYSKDNTFSPYWEQKIIKLLYSSSNSTYTEIETINYIDFYKGNLQTSNTNQYYQKIVSNPFYYKSNQITNTILYN